MITVVPLRYVPGHKWVHLREVCGKDEQSPEGTRSVDAIFLLDRLMQGQVGCVGSKIDPVVLPVADRDRILTAVFINTFGTKVESTVTCTSCHSRFDLHFSIDDWANDLFNGEPGKMNGNGSSFHFETGDGIKFRLPTGEDELEVMGHTPEEARTIILKKCVLEGIIKDDTKLLEEKMESVAPLADAEFEAPCPECSAKQWFHFNLQEFLLSSLIKEKETLAEEIHTIARSYGWGLNESLELPRRIRKSYVKLALASG